MINLSGKNAASRGYFEVTHSTVGFRPAAPVSVTSTVLNAGIIGCNPPGRSRLDLEETSCCEISFHGDYVPDLAQVIPKGNANSCPTHKQRSTHT